MSSNPLEHPSVQRATTASRVGAGVGAVALVILASVPLWASSSLMRTLVELLGLLALASMWNLLAGYAGLVSVGQQAFVGIGAYGLIVLGNDVGLNPFVSVALAGLVAMVVSIPTAAVAFRLRGGYFAIGTWVIAEVYRLLVVNTPALGAGTGKTLTAVSGIERATREAATYWVGLAVGVGSVLLVYGLLRSRIGLALTALRDDDTAADSVGVHTMRTKFIVWVAAGFGCGLAGALLYLNLLRVQPNAAFSINWTIYMIFIVMIGGLGTIEGPIVGTVVFVGLREAFGDDGTVFLSVMAALAILMMLRAPRGLWGLVADRFDLYLFPVQRRLLLPTTPPVTDTGAGGGPVQPDVPAPVRDP